MNTVPSMGRKFTSYWILMGSTGYYWVVWLVCILLFFCVLLASTLLHWVRLYATGFYCMLLASTLFYWVILASIARGANNFLSVT